MRGVLSVVIQLAEKWINLNPHSEGKGREMRTICECDCGNIWKEIIIHYFVWRNKRKVYLCNQAYYAKKSKSTRSLGSVTCKNCLKQLERIYNEN